MTRIASVVLCNENYISERELPPSITKALADVDFKHGQLKGMAGLPPEEIEKEDITQTLEKTSGNKSEAANSSKSPEPH